MYDVMRLQERLAELGFDPGPIDGTKGPRTDTAIRAFKRSVGLRDRAYVGPITLAALKIAQDHGPDAPEMGGMPWMDAGLAVKSLHEQRNYGALRKWFDKSVSWIDPRDVAWCGAYVATCHRIAEPTVRIPDNPLGARNWGSFGKSCAPVLGATLTFWRVSKSSWQGHVGFYWGEDDQAYHVLGGNQANAVTVTRIAKKRLLEARWPAGWAVTGRPVMLSRGGTPLSENEA